MKNLSRIQDVDISGPIILSADGHVMDGIHRVAKASILRRTHIQAVQFTEDPEPGGPSCMPSSRPGHAVEVWLALALNHDNQALLSPGPG